MRVLAGCFGLLSLVAMTPQISDEFRARYGNPDVEQFVVRPHVRLTAEYGLDGRQPGPCLDRRDALWAAGAVAQSRPERLPGIVVGSLPPRLPAMTPVEVTAADLWAVGLSPDHHPVEFAREGLAERGVLRAPYVESLREMELAASIR